MSTTILSWAAAGAANDTTVAVMANNLYMLTPQAVARIVRLRDAFDESR